MTTHTSEKVLTAKIFENQCDLHVNRTILSTEPRAGPQRCPEILVRENSATLHSRVSRIRGRTAVSYCSCGVLSCVWSPPLQAVPHTEQKSDWTQMAEVDPELKTDARWQLIERITASPSFQKSARIRDLLRYMAERTLHGQTQDLTEHRIGSAVFGKPPDYSVVDDSSVRVHVRQLRLKLHEYFDGEGREEACVVEIPKGAYTTLFRSVGQRTTPPVPAPAGELKTWLRWLPWALAVLFLVTTVTAWFYHPSVTTPLPPPWPLAALFTPPQPARPGRGCGRQLRDDAPGGRAACDARAISEPLLS